jgi:hypothetical protein
MRFKIISYLKVGYLLHIITLIELFFSFVLFYILDVPSWLTNDPTLMKFLVLSPLVVLPLMAQLDVRSRYQNYKLIKDHLYTYGFKTRILKPFLKSSCQRGAAKVAADELGMLSQCLQYFKSNGYRWYHLIPDIVLIKPSVLLTRNFWLTTFFTKTYLSKFNFDNINIPEPHWRWNGVRASFSF